MEYADKAPPLSSSISPTEYKYFPSGDIDKKEGLSFSSAVLSRFNSPFLEL